MIISKKNVRSPQRPGFCALWSGLGIGAWPVSCVRFSVAKQNKPRLETRARIHAAADSTGPPAHGRGVEKGAPGPSASPGRAEHDRTRLQPHEALPQAASRHDRLDETSLANLRLILIAIHLKFFIISYNFCHPKNQNHVKVGNENMSNRETKLCHSRKQEQIIVDFSGVCRNEAI